MTFTLDDFHVKATNHRVEAWSVCRLPYNNPSPSMLDLRKELKATVRALDGKGHLLAATYTSEDRSKCPDVENVLLYNVDQSLRLCVRGIRLERSFRTPVPAPIKLSEPARHHHCYAITDDESFAEWECGRCLAKLEFRLPRLGSVQTVWLAAHRGLISRDGESLSGHLALVVRLVSPPSGSFPTPEVMKRLLDGIVSALHAHDGTELDKVSERISQKVNESAADVAALLMDQRAAVLGRRMLVWLRAAGVQWGPADERLVAILVTTELAPDPKHLDFTVCGELYEATEGEDRAVAPSISEIIWEARTGR